MIDDTIEEEDDIIDLLLGAFLLLVTDAEAGPIRREVAVANSSQ